MNESIKSTTSLVIAIVVGILSSWLGIKSCNDSANLSQQLATNKMLARIDSTNAIQLTNLQTVAAQSVESVDRLTKLESNSEHQIDSLHIEIDRLKALYRIGSKELRMAVAEQRFSDKADEKNWKTIRSTLAQDNTELINLLAQYPNHPDANTYKEISARLLAKANEIVKLLYITHSNRYIQRSHSLVYKITVLEAFFDYVLTIANSQERGPDLVRVKMHKGLDAFILYTEPYEVGKREDSTFKSEIDGAYRLEN